MNNNNSQYIFRYTNLTPNSSLIINFQNNNQRYKINYMNKNQFHKNNKDLLYQNKFSMQISSIRETKKTMNDYYQNQFKQNEFLMNYVYSCLKIKGWIIFKNNGNYISNFTSFELFQFLTDILKMKKDLKIYTVRMTNNPMMFNGEQIYIILSQTLPIIIDKKRNELKNKNEQIRMKEKENNIANPKNSGINNEVDNKDDYDYNLNECKINCDENEDCKNSFGINVDDDMENRCDVNNINNNFFSNRVEENKFDNIDSSIFCQSHQ